MRRDVPHGFGRQNETAPRRMRWGFWPLDRVASPINEAQRTSRWPRDGATTLPSHQTPHGCSSRPAANVEISGEIMEEELGVGRRGITRSVGSPPLEAGVWVGVALSGSG